MDRIPYRKPHATAAERIAHLKARGLVITRPVVAARKIEAIGYERLRIYFLSRREIDKPGRPFRPGTTYQDIIEIYECDAKLRAACFVAVGQLEILLRNTLAEALSQAYGSHPYFSVTAFEHPSANIKALQAFLSIFEKSRDRRARHYRDTYSEPVLPPIWTMKEFLSFGASVRIFQCLNGVLRREIGAQFGVDSDDVFTSWLEALVDLRNICAHHDRLFNRRFQKQPKTWRRTAIPSAKPYRLKALLECLDYLLKQRGVPSEITVVVHKIISRYRQIELDEAGY